MSKMKWKQVDAESHDLIKDAVQRGFIAFKGSKVTYHLNQKKTYNWNDPEEWVRAFTISFLVFKKGYPPSRMKTEVKVPRRTPNDWADVVVYSDDRCKSPYIVVECKSCGQIKKDKIQGIEQLFGNANSLRSQLGLYEEYGDSVFYDVANYPASERKDNIKGSRDSLPEQYGEIPEYTYIAGPSNNDITPAKPKLLETKIRRAHSIIWAGGKRDPLTAFEEWSKILFAKVEDERTTPNNQPRKFQIGTKETTAVVATRIHQLFEKASKDDRTIFPEGLRINLADKKIYAIVKVLQDISITSTSADSIGSAFESFFGSVFRGELGQYFTMRQLARFTVAMLDINHDDYVIDPTAGSGGFLLEVLLQVWHKLDEQFAGRQELWRYKNDFALNKVFGIEIHEILARICKINLLLHHDGHTNVEGDRSCLDNTFTLPRLSRFKAKFSKIVGNPPFGDQVRDGDEDLLGTNSLSNFSVAGGGDNIPSEQVILERAISFLEPNGKLGLILPDGLLNNQGFRSNCPQTRKLLVKNGIIEAIVSLPDHAFRKSGAQNKTSILFFRKFTSAEKKLFESEYDDEYAKEENEEDAIEKGLAAVRYYVFLAEARYIGYTTTGAISEKNDLYAANEHSHLLDNQNATILGEYRKFQQKAEAYQGRLSPDCMAIDVVELWQAHESHRLDPKYHLFKNEEMTTTPNGWERLPISSVMKRRENIVEPELNPDELVTVMTISQTGEIREREAGKGNNPPEWLGMYFEDSPSTWYAAKHKDVVFSSIDLWKGCISVVPKEFDGALVTKEFPIYEITDSRIDPEFLSCLLRSRYYQRAFRAITTGHSNRRRTQINDFERLEICFPKDKKTQKSLIKNILLARQSIRTSNFQLNDAYLEFSSLIDGRGSEDSMADAEDSELSR